MSDEMMAANAEVQDVSTSEGLATPQEMPGSESTEGQSITETQAFARRLKEETAKAEQRALDRFIEQTYGEYGIRTYAEYQKALEEQQKQQEIMRLVQQNIPEEYAKEMMESREFRKQFEKQKQEQENNERIRNQYKEFLEAYPDIDPHSIPEEVYKQAWHPTLNPNGKPLLDVYARYENKLLREQLASYEAKQQTAQANQANAASSTGSAKGQGLPDSGFISRETFEQHRHDMNWIQKNYDALNKSRLKWGK